MNLKKYQIKLVEKKAMQQWIDTLSPEELLEASKSTSDLLQYLDENKQTEDIQLASVKNNGDAIQYIKEPCEAVRLAAVENNGYVIQYIKEPCEAVRLAAVKKNRYVIKYINKPSEAVQLAAVENNGNAIKYIEKPTRRVKQAVYGWLWSFYF